jgi:hypothetical protein
MTDPDILGARAMLVREAIASTALSHDEDCVCIICRAYAGEPDAVDRLFHNIFGESLRQR